jgi:hypothetical protein
MAAQGGYNMREMSVMVFALVFVASQAFAALTAEVDLEVKGDKVMAFVKVKQGAQDRAAGKVTIKWTAPADRYCADSIFELPYKTAEQHRTRAYRSWMMAIPKTDCTATCDGTWKVEIIAPGGKVLAEASIIVGKDGNPAETSGAREAEPPRVPAKPDPRAPEAPKTSEAPKAPAVQAPAVQAPAVQAPAVQAPAAPKTN